MMNQEHVMKHKPRLITKMVLLVLCFLLLVYVAFIKRDALRLETLKVGGSENMQLVTELYKSDGYKQQQAATIQQVLGSMKGDQQAPTQQNEPSNDNQPVGNAVSQSLMDSLKNDAYIKGNKNARITIVEYSDLLCPFCKRHYNAQTIENLITKYGKDVNMLFRQMPLPQLHPTAPIGAQGAVCVGKLGGADKFYAYLAEAFKVSEFTEANVTDIAKKVGVNATSFASCLTDSSTIATVAAQTKEGNSFGVNGTPGNVIIDNEKGTFTLLPGAYPSADFEKIIDGILGK